MPSRNRSREKDPTPERPRATIIDTRATKAVVWQAFADGSAEPTEQFPCQIKASGDSKFGFQCEYLTASGSRCRELPFPVIGGIALDARDQAFDSFEVDVSCEYRRGGAVTITIPVSLPTRTIG